MNEITLIFAFLQYSLGGKVDMNNVVVDMNWQQLYSFASKQSLLGFCFYGIIIRKTKCFRILERNAKISKTKRNFSRLYPTPQKFKKIDRLRRNEIHLKAVRTSS